jgi:membrane protein involved in colicin uptake
MGLSRKVASIMMLGGVSSHTGREPPGKAEWVRAKAERARKKAAEAQAVRAEAEAKVAEEQATALARAQHEDEAQRQADLRKVAEKEAEAVPDRPPGP